MFNCGRSVFHHRRALPFSWNTTMWTFMLEVYSLSEKHIAIFSNHALMSASSEAPKNSGNLTFSSLRGECYQYWPSGWWTLRGCRCPGLISIQMTDQCLRHLLKGPHQPNHITQHYMFLPDNLFISLGVIPLRRGCYWGHRASSPSTPSSTSATSSNHDYLHEYKSI
jgi:hypothetical protein